MNLDQWLVHQQLQHPDAIALGLERVRVIAQRLGLMRPARRVITVAGTNGKGSTVAFIEAIARVAGLRVGAYTSPHLLRYNERVRIDGVDATDDALVAAFERIEAARLAAEGEPIQLTYFEYGTLAALLLFEGHGCPSVASAGRAGATEGHGCPSGSALPAVVASAGRAGVTEGDGYPRAASAARAGDSAHERLDLAILEVGLGGRLDAVNIIDCDVAVITTIDLDHQEWLGTDREAIGIEKAGVMRAGMPVVLGESNPPASVLQHAYRIGAPAIRAGCDYLIDTVPDGWRWREPGYTIDLPEPGLAAPAQRANAAAAIAALRALDIPIKDAAIIEGVRTTRLSARMQSFASDGVEIVIDVAHNPQAAQQLAAWMAAHPVSGATFAVFSALGDKDLPGIVAPLLERIARWWLCGLHDTPRGLDGDALAERLKIALLGRPLEVLRDVALALQAARRIATVGDRIVVFGSFHTAADALRALGAD